jgi:hypothetical protein
MIFFSLLDFPAFAQVVDDVDIKETKSGYDLVVKFFIPLRYQSHSPRQKAKTLEIQVEPENFADPELSDRLNQRINVSWDIESDVPIREVVFDGQMAEQASIIVYFTKPVEFTVRNGSDMRSLIVSIKTDKPKPKAKVKTPTKPIISSDNLIIALKQTDPKMAELLDRANQTMLNKNYSRAVQLFTKIRDQGSDEVRVHVQELLGLAREYNGQIAHAKAEYRKYLAVFPEGEGAERVKQRLTALVTAAQTPKQAIGPGRSQREKDKSKWDHQVYGSFAQTYFRDETTPDDQDSLVVRSDLTTDFDLVTRSRKGDLDLKTQFIGSYRKDLRTDSDGGEFIPSILAFETSHAGNGLYARVGRQSRTTGGILGRFDGIHTAYEANETVTFNGVYGYPVDTSDKSKINSDQEFYGASMELNNLGDAWDFSTFYIAQENLGIKDREAVGAELRYFDTRKSFFTLVDYDTYYEDLNIFLFIGNWTITEGSTFNLVLDYRNSPILTTTNAIQGQLVTGFQQLLTLFNEDQLYQLAQDRTAKSQSATVSLTQDFSEDWQFIGEVTVTEFGDTVASGGVDAIIGTGKEYVYSSQIIANNLLTESDIVIFGLRYADTFNADTYSLTGNWRINVSRNLRFNPRLRIDYREDKDDDDTRVLARPFIRMDYRFRRWAKLEFDIGYEWLDEQFSGQSQNTTGYFMSAGYRVQF